MASETTHSRPRGGQAVHVDTEAGVTLDPPTDQRRDMRALSPSARAHMYSVQRTVLEARVAALEQTLEANARQRAEIVDRYEQILRERERTDDAVPIEFESERDSRSLTTRLRNLLRRAD